MPLYRLAAIAALLPLLTIHGCYLIAAYLGHVDWCIPHLQSCASISASGRQAPEYFLFKALMLPSAVVLAGYWGLSYYWLQQLGCRAKKTLRIMLGLGLLGCAGLVLYSVMLGSIGPLYQLQRRVGVTTFFGLTFIGQMLIMHLIKQRLADYPRLRATHKLLERSATFILALGLGSVVVAGTSEELYHRTDDAFEWSVSTLLCLHVLVTARLWYLSNFRLEFRVR